MPLHHVQESAQHCHAHEKERKYQRGNHARIPLPADCHRLVLGQIACTANFNLAQDSLADRHCGPRPRPHCNHRRPRSCREVCTTIGKERYSEGLSVMPFVWPASTPFTYAASCPTELLVSSSESGWPVTLNCAACCGCSFSLYHA